MHAVHPHVQRSVGRRLLVEFSWVLYQDKCFPLCSHNMCQWPEGVVPALTLHGISHHYCIIMHNCKWWTVGGSPHQMAPMLAYIGSSTQTPRTYGAQAVFQEGGGMCPTSYLVVSAHGATPWWVGGMPTKHVCSIWPHLVCGTWCACNGRDAVCFTYLGVLPSTPPFGYTVFCILVPRMWGSCHSPKCVVLSLSLGVVCFPLVCPPLHLASACVWQIYHRVCGFVIVIRSLVFMA